MSLDMVFKVESRGENRKRRCECDSFEPRTKFGRHYGIMNIGLKAGTLTKELEMTVYAKLHCTAITVISTATSGSFILATALTSVRYKWGGRYHYLIGKG